MAIVAKYREDLVESIGTVLSQNDDIKRVVEDATGKDAYNKFTNPMLPRAQQISEILEALEKEGHDCWFLTYVLVRAVQNDRLRQLIVKACPQTMD